MPIYTPTFVWRAILARKVGQSDLVLVCDEGSFSRSVRVRLQVSLCIGYDLCHHIVDPKCNFYILTPVTSKSKSNRGWGICR